MVGWQVREIEKEMPIFFSLVFEELVRKHHFLPASPLSTPGCHLTAGELITLPGGECQRRRPVPSLATQAG